MSDLSHLINLRIEAMRPKLQDTTRRNPLINNVLGARTASFIRIVDEKPQNILDLLCGSENNVLHLVPLPSVDLDPADENTQEFKAAFENAKLVDEEYLVSLDTLDFDNDEKAPDKQEIIERQLKDRLRELLELPARVSNENHSDLSQHARLHGIDPSATLPLPSARATDNRHEDDKLQTLLFPGTFQSRMERIFSKAKVYQEERGLAVMYLVLGYLRWTLPNESKDKGFKSPLILVPVILNKERAKDGGRFSLVKRQGIIFNPSLRHKLTVDAELDLEEALGDIDENDDLDIEAFFSEFASIKPKNMHWEVVREATFGVFPFHGIELFYDLSTDNLDFSEFPIISELMVGKESGSGAGDSFSEADVDSSVGSKLVPHLVLDADSSQFLALLKVANGENLALEGPPGSGKSQTIVNAIANTIYRGKKVLFVAQKVTALEVVYSRLEALGLGPLVLPFMGSHANSDDFYEALKSRLEIRPGETSEDLYVLRQKLHEQRDFLREYIDLVQKPVEGTSLTVHEVIGLCVAHSDDLKRLPKSLIAARFNPSDFSASFNLLDIKNASEAVADWVIQLRSAEILPESPWQFTGSKSIDIQKVSSLLATGKKQLLRYEHVLSDTSEGNRDAINRLSNLTLLQVMSSLEETQHKSLVSEIPVLEETLKSKLSISLVDLLEETLPSLNIIDKFKKHHNCDDVPLRDFVENESEITQYMEFLSSRSISDLTPNQIIQLEEELKATQNNLKQLANLLEEYPRISEICQPHQLVELKRLSNHWDNLRLLKKSVHLIGLPNLKAELREGYAVLRELQELLGAQPIPDLAAVKYAANVIENAGFLYFLSKNYKQAQRHASSWLLGGRPAAKSRLVIEGLRNLQAKVEKWRKLCISDECEQEPSVARIQVEASLADIQAMEEVASQLSVTPDTLFGYVSEMAWPQLLEDVEKAHTQVASWDALKTTLSAIESILDRVTANRESLFHSERLCQDLGIGSLAKLRQLFSSVNLLRDAFARADATVDLLDDRFSNKFAVEQFIQAYHEYQAYPSEIKQTLITSSSQTLHRDISHVASSWQEIIGAYQALLDAKGESDLVEAVPAQSILSTLKGLQSLVADTNGCQGFLTHHSVFSKARNMGLEDILWAMHFDCPVDDTSRAVATAIVHSLKESLESTHGGSLMLFSGQSLDSARRKLQEIDRKIIKISPQEVRDASVRLASPARGNRHGRKSSFTDMALLEHQLGRQRRTPPRKILNKAHNALMELFPCWMMVPVAVAQHLPRKNLFDLVIIDEASQMTPENSISALMRGQSALIAGDTNQLPPTHFFRGLAADTVESDDEDHEDITTEESSILELANVQFHPKHRLLWHYRSQHEELIAFSNHYVYDNELVIFPSPEMSSNQLGISLYHVEGTYQRGVNLVEAQEIVDAAIDFMKSTPHRSLGIVVMNQSQMEHIEGKILREAHDNSYVQKYIDKWEDEEDGLQKFFVKNLENVQGDERDVIFIGTVYGRDPLGKFYQRFGPINGASGKRRLNVLFSRAKQQIITFTSIPLSAFDPPATNEGATLLKRWLEFSATKRLGEVAHNHRRAGHPDSPFEENVIEAVRSLGYEAIPQVGVSSYFIDIGVKHVKYPFGYICGVECDGATYHSAKSARDRDRLREEVLGRLGWSLYRIWSTDWFRDPLGGREALKKHLASILKTRLKEASNREIALVDGNSEHENVPQSRMPDECSAIARESTPSAQEQQKFVAIGSKILVHYLDGPRAGAKAKFWIQRRTDDPAYVLEDYRTIGVETPIAQALLDATIGDVVSYKHGKQRVRVGLLRLE